MLASIYKTCANFLSPGNEGGKLQVFIFHRVLDKYDFLAPDEPDVKRFDQLIGMISDVYNVISLEDAGHRLKSNSLPKRAACITFDDGYLDNFTNALPIFKKYNTPATIFIATDFIGGEMMWNDIVIESIRSYSESLTIPELEIVNENCSTQEEKLLTINRLISKIKHMQPERRSDLVKQIAEITGFTPFPMMMSEDHIKKLRESGVAIGAHTCSHPILKSVDDGTARCEIAQSKEILESLLNEKINLFAYPNGRPGEDYTSRDVEIVRSLGFDVAVSTCKKIASNRDEVLEIPRFTPWDKNINKFLVRSLLETYRA